MPSLYELNKDYKELQAMLEVAETDEDMEAIQNTLDMLDCSIDEKIENTAMFIRNIKGDIQAFKNEAKRMQAKAKTLENMTERLKNNIDHVMKENQLTEKKVGQFKCYYKEIETVEVDDLDALPIEFRKVTIAADKVAIKKAIKAEQEVAGARIEKHLNLQIG